MEDFELIPPEAPGPDPMQGFAAFQAAYPRKQKWVRARAAWRKQKPSAQQAEKLLRIVELLKCSKQWEESWAIPLASSFINDRPWDDPIETYQKLGRKSVDPNRCPKCGMTWRVHRRFANKPGEQPNEQGSYCG